MRGRFIPRVQGTPRPVQVDLRLVRFIPACAGNTRRRRSVVLIVSVHPRVRGEHGWPSWMCDCSSGSSPRARGTLGHEISENGDHRFIPACAGNTPAKTWRRRMPSVHPRVRGEHGDREAVAVEVCRFIPACAGNTAHPARPAIDRTVHPRVRGEHVLLLLEDQVIVRFIPACAGNTWYSPLSTVSSAVHPRVRGEHLGAVGGTQPWAGSSPRARGTPLLQVTDQ